MPEAATANLAPLPRPAPGPSFPACISRRRPLYRAIHPIRPAASRHQALASAKIVKMTCQAIADPGPDGFTVPGIAKTISLMPEGTCAASSRLLANRHPELGYQEGVLVMRVGGELRASVRHAWNIGLSGEIIDTTNRPMTFGPGRDVTYSYLPDGPEHDAERRAVTAEIGEPIPFHDDPGAQDQGDQLAADWLDQATARDADAGPAVACDLTCLLSPDFSLCSFLPLGRRLPTSRRGALCRFGSLLAARGWPPYPVWRLAARLCTLYPIPCSSKFILAVAYSVGASTNPPALLPRHVAHYRSYVRLLTRRRH